jgi:uncharacterized membrane protein
MNFNRCFYNENLKDRATYLLWLILFVAALIGLQLLHPIIKPHRFSGSTAEWVLTIITIILVTSGFIFHRRFVSVAFDDSGKQIILTTMTLIYGDKTAMYNYSDINFKEGKEPASLRKKATEFIEIYCRNKKVIKLEKSGIGDYSFENIVNELQQLKRLD